MTDASTVRSAASPENEDGASRDLPDPILLADAAGDAAFMMPETEDLSTAGLSVLAETLADLGHEGCGRDCGGECLACDAMTSPDMLDEDASGSEEGLSPFIAMEEMALLSQVLQDDAPASW